jgi:hypothetical protein
LVQRWVAEAQPSKVAIPSKGRCLAQPLVVLVLELVVLCLAVVLVLLVRLALLKLEPLVGLVLAEPVVVLLPS